MQLKDPNIQFKIAQRRGT